MRTSNFVSCLKFGEQELKILVADVTTNKVTWRRKFVYDFKVFDEAGVIIDPGQVRSFIQSIFQEHDLPNRIRIALNLEYINLNTFLLPTISGPDFQQIIVDEAGHQSVFSFMNYEVAVAYQIIKDKINQDGVLHSEILAVTALQNMILQLNAVFQNTDLVIELITPSLRGLREYLQLNQIDTKQPMIIIFVSNQETEIFSWEDQAPRLNHYLHAGADEPEKLQKELRIALDYFYKQIPSETPITQIITVGVQCELDLGEEAKLQYLSIDEWPDLWGLAFITKEFQVLNFNSQTAEIRIAGRNVNWIWFWPILILGLFAVNFLAAWNMSFGAQRLAQMNNEYRQLQNQFMIKKQQFGMGQNQTFAVRFKLHDLLRDLSRIVTEDIMFDKLTIDLGGKSLQVEGFALSQTNLSYFLKTLAELKNVRSVDEIESSQQNRVNLTGYAFRFKVNLKEDLGQ